MLNKLNPEGEDYIFIHDDPNRGYVVNRSLIESNLKVITPIKTENIFDYCTILENAKQVHCMDSSFKHICDSLNPKGELFYHRYVRSTSNENTVQSKLDWSLL